MTRFEYLLMRVGDNTRLIAVGAWALAFVGIFAGVWRFRGIWLFYLFCTVVFSVLVLQWAQSMHRRHIREASDKAARQVQAGRTKSSDNSKEDDDDPR